MAVRRSRASSKMLRISDSVEGMSEAPKKPSSARPAMSISGLELNAASTEATPKPIEPPTSMRRRPIRSPRLPIAMSRPASISA